MCLVLYWLDATNHQLLFCREDSRLFIVNYIRGFTGLYMEMETSSDTGKQTHYKDIILVWFPSDNSYLMFAMSVCRAGCSTSTN